MPIPKIIHYCWFGNGSIPEKYQEYINEWSIKCPGFEIKKWDESNYDINKNIFVKKAYKQKKWAFVSDYARIDIINSNGGIYLDVDVQLLRSLATLLDNYSFFGIEQDSDHQLYINTGLGFGSEKNNSLLKEVLEFYDHVDSESIENIPCPIVQRVFFEKYGFKQKNIIQYSEYSTYYPTEYFAPIDCLGKIKITKNTYSIHHYLGSWKDNKNKREEMLYKKCVYRFGRKYGEYVFQILKKMKKKK